MSALASYGRCLDELDRALAAVPAGGWDAQSPCERWSIRDIAGHVIRGQKQMRCWVTGEEYRGLPGGPGTPAPAAIAEGDPLPRWREARAAADTVLKSASLDRMIRAGGVGEHPLAVMVSILTNDSLIHSWDVGHAAGDDPRLPVDLVAASHAWARDNLVRMPGFFGPKLAPPAGADEQTRWLAYLGRASWKPARTEARP